MNPLFLFQQKTIKENKNYYKLIQSIKSGIFQGRIKDGKCKFTNYKLIKEFKEISEKLTLTHYHPIKVYRSLHSININTSEIFHPLPFSTTLSRKFAEDWLLGTNKKNNRIILEFTIKNIPFIYIGQDEENELVLPPGNIILKKYLGMKNGIKKFECEFKFF